jgi:hypothetical protein
VYQGRLDLPASFSFEERLDFSQGHAPTVEAVFDILMVRIPAFKCIRKAPKTNDRTGVDYIVERYGLCSLQIDLKLREKDWWASHSEQDDLALETFSVIGTQKVGWTRDEKKVSDYILWFWQDTGRFYLLPFPPLCYVFQHYWEEWIKEYRTDRQYTRPENGRRGWYSACVFVPRKVIAQKIADWYEGIHPAWRRRA